MYVLCVAYIWFHLLTSNFSGVLVTLTNTDTNSFTKYFKNLPPKFSERNVALFFGSYIYIKLLFVWNVVVFVEMYQMHFSCNHKTNETSFIHLHDALDLNHQLLCVHQKYHPNFLIIYICAREMYDKIMIIGWQHFTIHER